MQELLAGADVLEAARLVLNLIHGTLLETTLHDKY